MHITKITSTIVAGVILTLPTDLMAYKRDKNIIKITHSNRKDPFSVEEELASFKLPEGFVIELVASEENGVINPIDLTFDDAGRLWTQTAEMYPMDPFGNTPNRTIRAKVGNPNDKLWKQPEYLRLKRLYKLEERGTDRILLIDDPTKKVEGEIPVVAEGLTMPQSILPYKNGVYVAHGSEMLYMEDADGDGKFEKPKTVLTGFSFIDSHTMSHTLVRGPGGWIHFSHGAMNLGEVTAVASGEKQQINYSKIARFSLDGKKIELVSSGLNNIWGFQLRADGQWYGTEANDKSHSVVPMEPGTGFLGIGNDKIRSYQPMVPVVHPFRVGGTGISGLAFSDDDANTFPEEWRNVAFLANPITNTINTVRVERDADGNIVGTHLDDLLKSSDEWFRPVNIEFGPDGCLYIADWYNKIVSHNELPRTDPTRDKSHGRIWRIRHESQKPIDVPNLIETKDEDLAKHLLGPTRWEKRAAWHQIADRQVKSLLPEIKKIAADTNNTVSTRVHAIWAFESLGEFDEAFVAPLLRDENHNIRREAIRSLASFELSAGTVVKLLQPLVEDKNCMVRSQVIRTLEEVQIDDPAIVELIVSTIKPDIPGNSLGGAYERSFERYLARKALETYPETLSAFLNSDKAIEYPVGSLLWASQAMGAKDTSKVFAKFWKMRGDEAMDDETFVSVVALLKDKNILKVVEPDFKNPKNFSSLLKLAVDNQSRVDSRNLAAVMTPALKAGIKSESAEGQALTMQVAAMIKSQAISKEVKAIAASTNDAGLIDAALPVLALDAKANEKLYKELAQKQSLPFMARLKVMDALNRVNGKEGTAVLEDTLKAESSADKASVAKLFSQSAAGAKTLMHLYANKLIAASDFDLSSAERVRAYLKKDKNANDVFAAAKKAEDERVAKLDAKVDQFMKAAQTLKGNPAVGQALFGSCLTCHAVGDQGYDIAPALDGSATRELHALITAIVKPDVAVEGGYNLHRVTRKDGTVVEGYLYQDNDFGMTIAQRGNQKTFIPKSDIKSEGSVTGKSFMPSEFDQWQDQMMVDLISYIKTLN
ncbi:PVC-type heme-binding CxxCH protein [Rubritalea spongiae]|uniref:PVC-type heme-binding CxxCH protein n=1 Tax=Rubritalea spongiae TaxID=430797 RepID=A0ABW5E1N6_9BACT